MGIAVIPRNLCPFIKNVKGGGGSEGEYDQLLSTFPRFLSNIPEDGRVVSFERKMERKFLGTTVVLEKL